MVGRNDPCPCGSGKKYKKCCLLEESGTKDTDFWSLYSQYVEPTFNDPEIEAWKKADARLIRRCMEHFDNSKPDVEKLMKKFWGKEILGYVKAGKFSEAHSQMFHAWIEVDYRPTYRSKSIFEQLETDPNLSTKEKQILSAINVSHMSAYQVVRIDARRGVELENILEGGRVFIHDFNLSLSAQRWAIVFCYVYTAGPYHFGAGCSFAFPPNFKEYIKQYLCYELERYRRAHTRANWHEFLKAKAEVFGHLTMEIHRQMAEPPKLANFDGEPLVLCTSYFEVENPQEFLSALRNCSNMDEKSELEGETRHFIWYSTERKKNMDRITLCRVEVTGNKVKMECNSRERRERGKELLQNLGKVKCLQDKEKSSDELFKEIREKRKDIHEKRKIPELQPPEVGEFLRQNLEDYYGRWVDQPIPALAGLTPNEAVKDPNMRHRLIDLIREMEFPETQSQNYHFGKYDWNKLRRRLGLPEE